MANSSFLKHCYVFLFVFFFIAGAYAQSGGSAYKKAKKKAEGYFVDEIFKSALPLYLQLDQLNPGDPEINYKIGVSYLHTQFKTKAIPFFEKAKVKDKENQYSDIDYYLGVAYHADHQFDKATDYYNKYKSAIDTSSEYGKQIMPTINKYLQNCVVGKILVASPIKTKIEHLNTNINTVYSETYPLISPDEATLYFSSQKHESTGGGIDEETDEFYEDMYVSKKTNGKWSLSKHVGQINSFKHDAPLCMSADQKRLYFYSTDAKGSSDIYYSDYKGTEWGQPVKMSESINSTSGEFGASISADGQRFYFSSDRPGGYGGMDIYVATLKPDSSWAMAVNMGPQINTSFDEESPEILPDGKTFYFSSDGPSSIGGLDLFKSVYRDSDSSWSAPVNMGYPLNTADHEYHFTLSADGKKGYFSSFRKDTYGEEDIYYVEIYEEEPTAKVFIKEEAPEDYALNKSFSKPQKGETLKQKAFFDFNIYSKPADFSAEQLQEVVDIMSNFPDVRIEIGGHTDSIGSLQINKVIAGRRAQAVYKYLIGRGVDSSRMKTQSYAFHQLVVNGKSTLENGPNRRVEFRVLSNNEFEGMKNFSEAAVTSPKQAVAEKTAAEHKTSAAKKNSHEVKKEEKVSVRSVKTSTVKK